MIELIIDGYEIYVVLYNKEIDSLLYINDAYSKYLIANTKQLLIEYLKVYQINNNYVFKNNKHQKYSDYFIKDIINSVSSK